MILPDSLNLIELFRKKEKDKTLFYSLGDFNGSQELLPG